MQSQKLKFTYRHYCQLPSGLLSGLDVSLGEILAAD